MEPLIEIEKPTELDGFSDHVRNAESVKVKLTIKQNCVLYCLQNGWSLITDSSVKGATVGSNKAQYQINNGLFWRLYRMGMIYQGDWLHDRYNYVLTELGKKVITKKVDIEKYQ